MQHERAYLKVAVWSLVLNELLTKTLPMFNHVRGGCEKIVQVVSDRFKVVQSF